MPMTAAQLRRLRKQMGLTQVQLAAMVGVSENTLARWERGEMTMREPAARLLRTLAMKPKA